MIIEVSKDKALSALNYVIFKQIGTDHSKANIYINTWVKLTYNKYPVRT